PFSRFRRSPVSVAKTFATPSTITLPPTLTPIARSKPRISLPTYDFAMDLRRLNRRAARRAHSGRFTIAAGGAVDTRAAALRRPLYPALFNWRLSHDALCHRRFETPGSQSGFEPRHE